MRSHAFALAVVLACGASSARAQVAAAPASGSITLISEPAGCAVRLEGRQRIDGHSPLTLERGLVGRYRVLGREPGYEPWRRTIVLDGVSRDTLWIKLGPKGAFRAAARSMLLPGWGQFYGERPTRGWVWAGLGAAAAAGAVYGELRYRDRLDDYEAAAPAALGEAGERLDDAKRDRKNLRGAAIGIWAAGVLDAAIFFQGPGSGPWRMGATWRHGPSGHGAPALALQARY